MAAGACLALAAASLLLAREPVYDAWSWLIWGRELAHGGLDATSGPSWKPLPPLVAAPLSLAGDGAPELWLVLVRAAWLLSIVLAAELAWTLAAAAPRGRRIAGAAFAAVALVLLHDAVTPWARQAAGGMSEPLLVALVLGAARATLARRIALALTLGGLAALLRPEAWLLLCAFALWSWRAAPRTRPLAAAVLLAVPVLWLAPELLDSGAGSSARARPGTSNPLEALGWAALLPPAIAWPLAALALRARPARMLGVAAIAWVAIVASMTLVGFAGLPRFMTPAAAIVCVLGGVGLAALPADSWRPRAALVPGALALALAVTAVGLPGRMADVVRGWSTAARIDDSHGRLRALVRRVGREPLLRCGDLATTDVLVRPALAWQLHAALGDVVSFGAPPHLSGAFVVGPEATPALARAVRRVATPLGREGEWRIYSIGCAATASASPVRSAGGSGATR